MKMVFGNNLSCEIDQENVMYLQKRGDTNREKIAPSDYEVCLSRGQRFCDANESLF